jgi:hypothetical protein
MLLMLSAHSAALRKLSQAFGWSLATLPLLCQLRGWGLFLLFTTASIATAVSGQDGCSNSTAKSS